MKRYHRKILSELMDYCIQLGHDLDYTATSIQKLKDRQRAHAHVAKILFAIMSDMPENDHRLYDIEQANEALLKIKELTNKIYTDKNGEE